MLLPLWRRSRGCCRLTGRTLPSAVDALHRAVTEIAGAAHRARAWVGVLDWNRVDDTFVTEGPEESGMIDIRVRHDG